MILHILSPRYSTTRASAALYQQLETILERNHVRICVLLQLECVRNDLDAPGALGLVFAHLKADPEVARVLGHAAEGIHGAVGVGFAVVFEPEFYHTVSRLLRRKRDP